MPLKFEPRTSARLAAKLRQMEPATREGVVEAMEKVGGRIERSAKRRAPRRTGALRKSIMHEIDRRALQLTVGTNIFYARFVEFGTMQAPIPQAFLFPAAKASRRRNQKEIAQAISGKVKKAARR